MVGTGTERADSSSVELVSETALQAGLEAIRRSPTDEGELALIVVRPRDGGRKVVGEAALDVVSGVVGDNWSTRPNRRTPDGGPDPEAQVTVMNARVVGLLAGDVDRWPLAGDQLYVDFDLSHENLPAGTHLEIGTAVLEITAKPHRGCAKFRRRFGEDALRFVNSPEGASLRLRGLNARVVRSGLVRTGDTVRAR